MEECKYQLTISYFFLLGLWTLFTPAILSYTALEDVLSGTLWPSTVVLIAYSIPDITAKVFSPYIIKKISFRTAFILLTLLLVGSLALLVIIDDVRIRIAGVSVAGAAYGFGMIACVRMLSYYKHAYVHANAFQNGCNTAVLAASLAYTGLTTWTCAAPRTVLAACIPFCFLPFVIYLLLDKEPLKDHLRNTTARQSIEYTMLPDDDEDDISDGETTSQTTKNVSKFWFIFKVFPLVAYAFLSNFCTHLIMTSILTTLTFRSSLFQPRDHFQYYRLLNNFGISTGGGGSLLFLCFDVKWNDFFRIRRIWILVLLNIFHLLFFVFASWYRIIPHVIVVLAMCFTQGILSGLTALVQCAISSASQFSNARDKGTAIGMIEVGLSVGLFAASLLGISTENVLREHCTDRLMLGRFCLARPASSAEWNANIFCK